MTMRALAATSLLLALAASGCLGGEARSEWAYNITQIDGLAKEGLDGEGVVVAVLDTGVNVGHPSLDHLDDGKLGNGEVVAFRNFLEGRQQPYDPDGHGSHVVGIMAARGSGFGDKLVYGGVDLKGGSPAAQLVVARVCTDEACDEDAIPDAIRWAVAQRADVISLSLGGLEQGLLADFQETAIEVAVNAAIDQGVVVIAAAGNEGPNNPDVFTPASIPGVIAVGAIQKDGSVADISSRGDDEGNPCTAGSPLPFPVGGPAGGRCDPNKKPELVAPGVNILSAWAGDSYVRATGTSQATPFVTSVVALLLQGRPDLTDRADVQELKQALVDTARPVKGQEEPHDEAAGYGIVQAERAFEAYT